MTAGFLIPAYTLLFAGETGWLSTNFSRLAVLGEGRWRAFVLWGAVTGGYFLAVLSGLGTTMPGRLSRRGVYAMTWTALAALLGAVLIPYLPERFPADARRHVTLAMGACVLLMAALGLVVVQGCREDLRKYRGTAAGWLVIAAVSGVMLVWGEMVTSALEVYFATGSVLLGRRLWQLRRG